MAARLTIEQQNFTQVQARLKGADKTLKRDLNKHLRVAATEIKSAEQSAALGLPSRGSDGNGLRASIADATAIRISNSKTNPGVTVYVKRNSVRGHLGAATNRARGWRHPVFGTSTWVLQVMSPGWWGRAARPLIPKAKAEIQKALDETAKQIAKG